MKNPSVAFSGKCILFSGDFRQTLPVVSRGSHGIVAHLCLKSSPIFEYLKLLHLTENMRLQSLTKDPYADKDALNYPDYLLEVGERKLKHDNGSETDLTPSINVLKSSHELVHSIFADISNKYTDKDWLTSRAILVRTNIRLRDVNDQVSQFFPGVFRTYMSADSVVCDDVEAQKSAEFNYSQELLDSIEAGSSLTDHKINLKEVFFVMLP